MLCDQNISHISRYFVTDNGIETVDGSVQASALYNLCHQL